MKLVNLQDTPLENTRSDDAEDAGPEVHGGPSGLGHYRGEAHADIDRLCGGRGTIVMDTL